MPRQPPPSAFMRKDIVDRADREEMRAIEGLKAKIDNRQLEVLAAAGDVDAIEALKKRLKDRGVL